MNGLMCFILPPPLVRNKECNLFRIGYYTKMNKPGRGIIVQIVLPSVQVIGNKEEISKSASEMILHREKENGFYVVKMQGFKK